MALEFSVAAVEANAPRTEDIFLADPASGSFAVLDGHGGFQVAEFVKTKLGELFGTLAGDPAPLSRLAAAFRTIDVECLDTVDSDAKAATGCCATVVLAREAALHIAHLGDTRLVLGRRRNTGAAPSSPETPTTLLQSVEALVLTEDHVVQNKAEQEAVVARSRDGNAIRLSKAERGNSRAQPRVAGHLAVTRAFGDAYLKLPQWASTRGLACCPYITAEPQLVTHTRSPDDLFLVLASDGLWEFMETEAVVAAVADYFTQKHALLLRPTKAGSPTPGHAGPVSEPAQDIEHASPIDSPLPLQAKVTLPLSSSLASTAAEHLLGVCLSAIAAKLHTKVERLKKLPLGPRRHMHDDITIIVVVLNQGIDPLP